jgi:type IV pilus assembly protein PilA
VRRSATETREIELLYWAIRRPAWKDAMPMRRSSLARGWKSPLARAVHSGVAMHRRLTPSRTRGFTLTEVMITVAIIGVLSTLAIYGVRRYVLVSKTSEPIEIINGVRAAEEAYKDETFGYLGTTTNLTTYHPGTPNGSKRSWEGTGVASWKQLGVAVSSPVQFGYACVAGTATTALPALGITGNVNYPENPGVPFYVVKAVGDRDEDSVFAVLLGSSFTDEIYIEKDDE